MLEAFWYGHFAIFTEYISVVDKLGGVTIFSAIILRFSSSCCTSTISLVVRGEIKSSLFHFENTRFMDSMMFAVDALCSYVELW